MIIPSFGSLFQGQSYGIGGNCRHPIRKRKHLYSGGSAYSVLHNALGDAMPSALVRIAQGRKAIHFLTNGLENHALRAGVIMVSIITEGSSA